MSIYIGMRRGKMVYLHVLKKYTAMLGGVIYCHERTYIIHDFESRDIAPERGIFLAQLLLVWEVRDSGYTSGYVLPKEILS